MGAGKVLVFLFSVCDSPMVSALHAGMAERVGIAVGIVVGEFIGLLNQPNI